jgi:hypothetical protein
MLRIAIFAVIVALLWMPASTFAATGTAPSPQQDACSDAEDPSCSSPPADEGAAAQTDAPPVATVYVTEYVTETLFVEEIVPVEQIVTVVVTEIVPVEQVVIVEQIVPVTETVIVETIVPVTETVIVTEVVPVEQVVTIFVTEVVTVEQIVLIEQIVPVTQTVVVTDIIVLEPLPASELLPTAPAAPITPTSAASTTLSGPPLDWTELSPPYTALSPLPATGLAMFYAPYVMDGVAAYRERTGDLAVCPECIGQVALLRAGDLGRKVWIQLGEKAVEGPFQVLDVAARHHIPDLLRRNWVVDVDYATAVRWGMNGPVAVTVYDEPPEQASLPANAETIASP